MKQKNNVPHNLKTVATEKNSDNTIAETVITDECGDSLWDAVLAQQDSSLSRVEGSSFGCSVPQQ